MFGAVVSAICTLSTVITTQYIHTPSIIHIVVSVKGFSFSPSPPKFQEYEDLDEILARYIQPMAAFARDLLTHKVYRAASGAEKKALEKLLSEEKRKNPKRIPYFFSACRKSPGKFALAYQPASKSAIEYFSLTPDGYRYRGKVHSNVNVLVTWFKAHYQDPIPRPIPTMSQSMPPQQSQQYITHQQHAGINSPSPIPSRVSSIPYTPQWPSSTPTPPPHYGGHQAQASFAQPTQQYGSYGGGYQQYHTGGGGGGHYGHGGGQYQGAYQRAGGSWGAQPSWTAAASFSHTPGQTPGRTPAYTPTQSPGSFVGSMTGTPHNQHRQTPRSPIGTPLLDE